MTAKAKDNIFLLVKLAPWLLAGLGFVMYAKGDERWVRKEDYDRDQTRVEKKLDEVSSDIKTLLRGR